MDIRVLRYFITVAREENITRAAESLHISQPSLSKQLMELENELDKQLLIRGKRKITLTEDGILLRKRAEEILTLFDKTKQELSGNDQNIHGIVSIGGIPNEQILSAAAKLRQKYPDVCFDFYSADAIDVTQRLDHGSLDFAVLLKPIDTVKYDYLSFGNSIHWGLLLPKDCELADKKVITRHDLCSVPLIMHSRLGLQREITHWAKTSIEHLNISATYNVLGGDSLAYVRSGLGYLLASTDHLPKKLDSDLCFRELQPTLELNYALVWKRSAILSRSAQAFLKEL